jgi:hypothetical protein
VTVNAEADSGTASASTREIWAALARDALIDTAHAYNSVITYKELSELVQERSGVRTRQLMTHWVSDVLGRVARDCGSREEPILSALCVDSTGSVGAGYLAAVRDVQGELTGDPDDHAASERLACYGHFGAVLPRGGGLPTLTPQVQRARDRKSALRMAASREPTICPHCYIAVPASGICENCD